MSKRKQKAAFAIVRSGAKMAWFFGQDMYETTIEPGACPFCLKVAVTGLPAPLLKVQPDGTTHVCHPSLGGCNYGFIKGS